MLAAGGVEVVVLVTVTGVVVVVVVAVVVAVVESISGVELVGRFKSDPGPELDGVSVVGIIAAPFNAREFSIISRVVRKLTNGCA